MPHEFPDRKGRQMSELRAFENLEARLFRNGQDGPVYLNFDPTIYFESDFVRACIEELQKLEGRLKISGLNSLECLAVFLLFESAGIPTHSRAKTSTEEFEEMIETVNRQIKEARSFDRHRAISAKSARKPSLDEIERKVK
jgi:hypothetical protein